MSTTAAVLTEVERPRAAVDSFYRPGLDILRALAFLLVFVAHGLVAELDKSTQLGAIGRAGEFGVCVFFFLSSYLITELLLREKRETGTIHIPAFYVRRILRIWPLYFAMIGVGSFYGLFSPAHSVSLAWGAALMLLFTNWYTAGHGYPPGFLFPLWSISLEEQFYLAWPCLVKYLSPGSLLGISTVLMTTAYLTLARLLHQGTMPRSGHLGQQPGTVPVFRIGDHDGDCAPRPCPEAFGASPLGALRGWAVMHACSAGCCL